MYKNIATKVILNGNVLTMADDMPKAEAVAINGTKIIAVGSNEEIKNYISPETEVLDVDGRVVIPGLADIHVHVAMDAANVGSVEIRDFYDPSVTSVKVILDRIKERADKTPAGEWIHAHGAPMQDGRLEERRFPTKEELDEVAPNNPCYASFGAHVAIANSCLLKTLGITRDTPNPHAGLIVRDEAGEPTGEFQERPAMRILELADESKPKKIEDGIEKLLYEVASRGTTVVHENIYGPDEVLAYQNLCDQGRLPVRVHLKLRVIESDLDLNSFLEVGIRQKFGNDMLKIGGVKMSIDGGFTGRQGAFKGMNGLIRISQERLNDAVEKCHLKGIRCHIHAIGDEAVDMALTALEKAQEKLFLPDIRHRIEHAGNWLFTKDLRDRAKKIGVIPVSNPCFLYFVGDSADDYIGKERNEHCYCLRTLKDEGFTIAFGSDATVYYPVDVIRDIAAAVTRKSIGGNIYSPEEAITFHEGLVAQTKEAAWVGFEENLAGTLEPGKIADICVLDKDPDQCTPDELFTLPVKYTICAGKITHKA